MLISFNTFAAAPSPFKVASIEFNPQFHARDKNFQKMASLIADATKNGAKLILFPEMSTTGYLYHSRKEIAPYVDSIPGVTTTFFQRLAKKYNVYIVVGMPEKSKANIYYNSAFLVGPKGLIGSYRKNNLFTLESTWAARGEGIPVFHTPLGNIAIIICYDDYFYQSARLAALKGANIVTTHPPQSILPASAI